MVAVGEARAPIVPAAERRTMPRSPGPDPAVSSRPSTFASLQHRNFRLLWIGQIVSLCGSMMQSTVINWHVTLLVPDTVEAKALALAMVGLARVVPIVVFSLVGGV